MAGECGYGLAGGGIPDLRGLVFAGGDDAATIGGKLRALDRPNMASERDAQCAVGGIPDLGGSVEARRDDPLTVR